MKPPQFDPDQEIDLLIVDPRPDDYRRLIAAALEKDLIVRKAREGERALELASRTPVSLWLANIHLPDMSGIELLQLVRARRPDARCLLVSDAYLAQDELAARTAGASAYLCKPVDPAWLRLCRTGVSRSALRKGAPTSLG